MINKLFQIQPKIKISLIYLIHNLKKEFIHEFINTLLINKLKSSYEVIVIFSNGKEYKYTIKQLKIMFKKINKVKIFWSTGVRNGKIIDKYSHIKGEYMYIIDGDDRINIQGLNQVLAKESNVDLIKIKGILDENYYTKTMIVKNNYFSSPVVGTQIYKTKIFQKYIDIQQNQKFYSTNLDDNIMHRADYDEGYITFMSANLIENSNVGFLYFPYIHIVYHDPITNNWKRVSDTKSTNKKEDQFGNCGLLVKYYFYATWLSYHMLKENTDLKNLKQKSTYSLINAMWVFFKVSKMPAQIKEYIKNNERLPQCFHFLKLHIKKFEQALSNQENLIKLLNKFIPEHFLLAEYKECKNMMQSLFEIIIKDAKKK